MMQRLVMVLLLSLGGAFGWNGGVSAARFMGWTDETVSVGQPAGEMAEADKIIGVYYVVEDETGEESKIRIARDEDGTYYAQVVWMKNPNMPDGSPKLDFNNPDPACGP